MIPGLTKTDMSELVRREMRTETRLEKALNEIERLKKIIRKLRDK